MSQQLEVEVKKGVRSGKRSVKCDIVKVVARKITITSVKKKLWKQISQFIKERDDWTCWLCGKKSVGSGSHCSHILPKGIYPRYEFEEWNLKTLCMHCHLEVWHKDPLMVALDFKEKYPAKYLECLGKARKYKSVDPYTKEDYMKKYTYYISKNS